MSLNNSTDNDEDDSSINLNNPVNHNSFKTDGTNDLYSAVNPKTLYSHLILLNKFNELEQIDSMIDMRYLLRAEQRYLIWLKMLSRMKFPKKSVPIPPLDVCYIWYVHVLSPLRYYEDISRLYSDDLNNEIFNCNIPLEKLNEVYTANDGKHIDDASKELWEEHSGQPWTLDPLDDSDFLYNCPWCNNLLRIPTENYVKMMRTEEYTETCKYCNVSLSAETISAKRFLDDCGNWKEHGKVFVGGTLVDFKTGEKSPEVAREQCNILFSNENVTMDSIILSSRTSSTSCQWAKIMTILNQLMKSLKVHKKLKNLRDGVVRRIIDSYMKIPSPFSLDLINTVLRRRVFTKRMYMFQWQDHQYERTIFFRAVIRYHKFLLLLKDKEGKKGKDCLVPTLDIDLSWHTHMLHPQMYRRFTFSLLNRMVNHDDDLTNHMISKGFSYTAKSWYQKYDEPYTHEDPKKSLLTKRKRVVTCLLPPFRISYLWKINQGKEKENQRKNMSSTKESESNKNNLTSMCETSQTHNVEISEMEGNYDTIQTSLGSTCCGACGNSRCLTGDDSDSDSSGSDFGYDSFSHNKF